MQQLLAKYGKKGVVFLSINVESSEDAVVVPFMKNNGYEFITLKASWDWAKKNYDVSGTPTNFLIDGQGRIIFNDPRPYDAETHAMVAKMIEAMLEARPKT
jgi:thioredoxin-related protein